MPMQPNPPRRVYPPVPIEDRQRIADAVRFYVERCAWSSGDMAERAQFERIAATIAQPIATGSGVR